MPNKNKTKLTRKNMVGMLYDDKKKLRKFAVKIAKMNITMNWPYACLYYGLALRLLPTCL